MGDRAQTSPFGHQGIQTQTFDLETLGLEPVAVETKGADMVNVETVELETVELGSVDLEIMDFGSGAFTTGGVNTVGRSLWFAWTGRGSCSHRRRASTRITPGARGSSLGWWAGAKDTPADWAVRACQP